MLHPEAVLWKNCKDANNTAHLLFDIFIVSFRLSLVSCWQAANFRSMGSVLQVRIKPHLQMVCKTQWAVEVSTFTKCNLTFSMFSKVLFTLHIVINFYCSKHLPGENSFLLLPIDSQEKEVESSKSLSQNNFWEVFCDFFYALDTANH